MGIEESAFAVSRLRLCRQHDLALLDNVNLPVDLLTLAELCGRDAFAAGMRMSQGCIYGKCIDICLDGVNSEVVIAQKYRFTNDPHAVGIVAAFIETIIESDRNGAQSAITGNTF